MNFTAWLEALGQDLRYGARQLRMNPGFTAVGVLSLALGIGANTAIFQLVDAVRLRTLPVKDPQELVSVIFPKGSHRAGWFSSRNATFTWVQWELIRDQQKAFSGALAWAGTRFNLMPGGEARYAGGMYVTADFFDVLGVPAAIGRTFTKEDDTDVCPSPGAVVSYAFWQRELGGDPAAVGRTVTLDGRPFPVLGVTPAGFFGVEVGRQFEVAIPTCADRLLSSDGKGRKPVAHGYWLSILARLKPGWTAARATAHLQALAPGIMQGSLPPTYRPDMAKNYLANKLEAVPGASGVSELREQFASPLLILLVTTGLVLLIACANLANLLLARASVREKEMAIRLAMGASRARLIRQLLAESLLLAVSGAAFGAALAQILSRALVAFLSTPYNTVFVGLGIDLRVLGFTAALAVGTCLLFGLLPAWRATRLVPAAAMRAGGRGMSAGREKFGVRRALVVSQVALSLVLMIGALLFVRSLRNLMSVDAGFRTEGVILVELDLRRPSYAKERLPVVYRDLLERLRSRPGVVSAAEVNITPVSGSGWNGQVRPDGSTSASTKSNFTRVGPDYFRTMGIGLLAGRDFNARDSLKAPKVAVVNEAFVAKVFGGVNPVGRSFRQDGDAGKVDPLYQVVGVVRNTKYYELREEFLPIAFLSMAQEDDPGPGMTYVVRASSSLRDVMSSVKAEVAQVHPGIGIEFAVLKAQIENSLMRERLMATLTGAFGILAGLLATLGLYGVIAYMVAKRRNEIG
ncbi:MAG: ABC transporter permease, partial [Bryobacteraceae bacterium]